MRIQESQVVRAPREKVFKGWTDYEAWPKFSDLFTHVTVLERAGNSVRVEADTKVMGRTAKRTEKHVLTPPRQILVEGETEGTPNTTVWTFDSIPEGTRLTVVVEVPPRGLTRLLGPLARRQAQKIIRQWLQGLARYVEET